MGGEASKEGDVYSYGILVLEIFSKRRPTDEMFKEGLNLHDFVSSALPERLVEVVDPTLVSREISDEEFEDAEEINSYENLSHVTTKVKQCLLSVLEIGVACSMESPMERMNMNDVNRKLHLIKDAFLDNQIHRERPNRR
ncbi:hypothetical protein P3X46_022088 [Hevea brasiliensis]|uniref:Serine-threonine/tyrosine-protein kinase catalytic domain-containing protein n=2 Tax=Hevea brasiliensis TaxID=3981 RepID=A0ABQ9LHJ2_HEVBR|nr:hypothetical protein P3X46_022088 [Hevea brasiliensis]